MNWLMHLGVLFIVERSCDQDDEGVIGDWGHLKVNAEFGWLKVGRVFSWRPGSQLWM